MALIAAIVIWARPDATPPRLVLVPIEARGMADPFFFSLSPDGTRIAYPAETANGTTTLWIRRLDSLTAHVLPGTEGALVSDWSPDGRSIVFGTDGFLKRIAVSGGPAQTLTRISAAVRRSSWNREGVILFTDGPAIRRIPDTGGEGADVTVLYPEETNHSTPWFLPDGRHFLFTAWSNNPGRRFLYVASLDSTERTPLMPAESKALYVSLGFIVFRQGDTLMARPFDADRLEFTGEATSLGVSVFSNPELGQTAFYASAEGTLALVGRVSWTSRFAGHRIRSSLPITHVSCFMQAPGRMCGCTTSIAVRR